MAATATATHQREEPRLDWRAGLDGAREVAPRFDFLRDATLGLYAPQTDCASSGEVGFPRHAIDASGVTRHNRAVDDDSQSLVLRGQVQRAADVLRPTRAEIDLDAIAANFHAVTKACASPVMAVVKCDAYGHGVVPVAHRLVAEGVRGFAVALAEEGLELRAAGIEAPILLLNGVYGGGSPRGGRIGADARSVFGRGATALRGGGSDLESADLHRRGSSSFGHRDVAAWRARRRARRVPSRHPRHPRSAHRRRHDPSSRRRRR